jgi:peptidyl-dipeptidase A
MIPRALRTSSIGLAALVVLSAACGGETEPPQCPKVAALPPPPPPPVVAPVNSKDNTPPTPEEAKAFIDKVDRDLRRLWTSRDHLVWVRENFITEDTEMLSSDAEAETAGYMTRAIKESTRYDGLQLDADTRRKFLLLKLAQTVPAPSDEKERKELADIEASMDSAYGKGKYCPDPKKTKLGALIAKKVAKAKTDEEKKAAECLSLGELSNVIKSSRNYDELTEAWSGWHAISPPMKDKFARYVELGNKGSKEIGFADLGALWRSGYDMPAEAFEQDIERLWTQVKPLYDELQCYVREKLATKYGKDKFKDDGLIPAQLLGNMWAQEWQNVYSEVEPYPGQGSLDVDAKIKASKYKDPKEMVRLGEAFFTSLGMDPLPQTFWERSLFTKPQDRDVVCHASAWDPSYNNDLRIKMCIEPTEEDLITIHHELGHDYYFHAYYKLPILFQQGANDGFHEGIGDTLALSVTPEYLKRLNLLGAVPKGDKATINVQMKMALDKVAFLPFGLLIDKWRWDVMNGKTPKEKYNEAWWALRKKYQGVSPPLARSEADFDPGAKYHVPASVPYIRYFLARIYQFQFHRALCKAAGNTKPLYECSIYGSKDAGAKLEKMLELGASKPWPEALSAIGGENQADATAMLEYFAPLRTWLAQQNKGKKCGF